MFKIEIMHKCEYEIRQGLKMHLFDNRHDFTSKSGVQLKSAENIQYLFRAMGSVRLDLSDSCRIDKTNDTCACGY